MAGRYELCSQIFLADIKNILLQEFNSEPQKYRSRFLSCSSCLAVEMEYRNIEQSKASLVVEKFCGYLPVRRNNTQCSII